jgi:hypothetical protein
LAANNLWSRPDSTSKPPIRRNIPGKSLGTLMFLIAFIRFANAKEEICCKRKEAT